MLALLDGPNPYNSDSAGWVYLHARVPTRIWDSDGGASTVSAVVGFVAFAALRFTAVAAFALTSRFFGFAGCSLTTTTTTTTFSSTTTMTPTSGTSTVCECIPLAYRSAAVMDFVFAAAPRLTAIAVAALVLAAQSAPPLFAAGLLVFRLTTAAAATPTLSATTTMTSDSDDSTVCECVSLAYRLAAVLGFFVAGALLLTAFAALALAVPFARPLSTARERLQRVARIYRLRLAVRELFYAAAPTLPQIRALSLLGRFAALIEHPDSYALEGPGAVYVTAVVDNATLDDWLKNRIDHDQFLARFRVKVGESSDLPARQDNYRACDVGQTHFWLYAFHLDRRQAAEKMCHYSFLDAGAPRAHLDCSCGKVHQEYWWLKDLGGFGKVEERVREVCAAQGQADAEREPLGRHTDAEWDGRVYIPCTLALQEWIYRVRGS
ncbi:hypothetical protein C8R46DRAFT_1036421 [Mycena filopes]|nr:hypothetical protein C8R46DRAFT_1036421 [Mycena filopes]